MSVELVMRESYSICLMRLLIEIVEFLRGRFDAPFRSGGIVGEDNQVDRHLTLAGVEAGLSGKGDGCGHLREPLRGYRHLREAKIDPCTA